MRFFTGAPPFLSVYDFQMQKKIYIYIYKYKYKYFINRIVINLQLFFIFYFTNNKDIKRQYNSTVNLLKKKLKKYKVIIWCNIDKNNTKYNLNLGIESLFHL